MFGIGVPELMLILVLALIVLGPDKLPQLAKQIAKFVGELKRASEDFKQQLDVEGLEDIKELKEMANLRNPETWKKNFDRLVSVDDEPDKTADASENAGIHGDNAKQTASSDLPGGLGPEWKVARGSEDSELDVVNPDIDPEVLEKLGEKKESGDKSDSSVPEK